VTNDIHALHPEPRKAAQAAIAELRDKKIPFKVTSTLRTALEQFALWLQGRVLLVAVNRARKLAGMYPIGEKQNTYTVTNCDGVDFLSRHQSSDTLDVVPLGANGNPIWPPNDDPRWGEIAVVMERHGFRAGLRWSEPDPSHYEWVHA
jgi:hypothetical protein